MDAPSLRDQMSNTKTSQMLRKCDNVQASISLVFQQPPPLMACDSHVGDSKFKLQIIPNYIFGLTHLLDH